MYNKESFPYRQSTHAYIIKDGEILIIQKLSYKDNEWGLPGGGIEDNETASEAMLRELKEELGCDKFEIVKVSNIKYKYDWPDSAIEQRFKKDGKYFRGQELTQFLVSFTGEKDEIKKQDDEIRIAKWVSLSDMSKYFIFNGEMETVTNTLKDLQVFK